MVDTEGCGVGFRLQIPLRQAKRNATSLISFREEEFIPYTNPILSSCSSFNWTG